MILISSLYFMPWAGTTHITVKVSQLLKKSDNSLPILFRLKSSFSTVLVHTIGRAKSNINIAPPWKPILFWQRFNTRCRESVSVFPFVPDHPISIITLNITNSKILCKRAKF